MARSSQPKSALAGMRARIPEWTPNPLGLTITKHLDEQAIVILETLHLAVQKSGMLKKEFHNWGTVTSPRHPGRSRLIQTINKFKTEGAWVVSPHIVPFDSLHSHAGLISQVYGIHGPNLGAGGMAGLEGQVFMAALTLLFSQEVTGLWLGWSCWNPEIGPNWAEVQGEEFCQGVILGITPEPCPAGRLGRIEFHWGQNIPQAPIPQDLDFPFLFHLAAETKGHFRAGNRGVFQIEFSLGQ